MDPTVELLQALAPAVPENMTVIVLCDRGIASPKLWQQIRDQGWHPGMRYRKNITFCATAANDCPPSASSPVPIRRGLVAAPPSAPPRPNAAARCWWSGTPNRRNPGSSSPTCRRRRSGSVGTPCASGSNWASRPSRAWAGSGTRPVAPTHSRVPPLAGAVGGYPAGPGLRHQGGRRPGPEDCSRQPAGAAQGLGSQSPGPSYSPGAHRQRDPPRHRLAPALAAQGAPLEPRLAAARTLATTQAQPGDFAMSHRKNPIPTPVRGGNPQTARRSGPPGRPGRRRTPPSNGVGVSFQRLGGGLSGPALGQKPQGVPPFSFPGRRRQNHAPAHPRHIHFPSFEKLPYLSHAQHLTRFFSTCRPCESPDFT